MSSGKGKLKSAALDVINAAVGLPTIEDLRREMKEAASKEKAEVEDRKRVERGLLPLADLNALKQARRLEHLAMMEKKATDPLYRLTKQQRRALKKKGIEP